MNEISELVCKFCSREINFFAYNQGLVEIDKSSIPYQPVCNICINQIKSKPKINELTPYQQLKLKVSEFSKGMSTWVEVLKIAKDIEPYDTNDDYCYPEIQMDCSGNRGRVGKNSWEYCGGCNDGFMGPTSWKAIENLKSNKDFKILSKNQIEEMYAAIQNIDFPIVWKHEEYEKDKKNMHEMDFYMKYEYQFKDYAEAKEWYDSQNK